MMIEQNELLRSKTSLGSFQDLFRAVTVEPRDARVPQRHRPTTKWDPNENYGREMMELFSLGADRGAYTEDDVREMARSLTGWTQRNGRPNSATCRTSTSTKTRHDPT